MTLLNDTGFSLGKRFKTARMLADMEQAEVARRIGVARQTISNWERGLAEPPVTYFVRFAALVGQPLDWFAEAVNTEAAPSEDEAAIVGGGRTLLFDPWCARRDLNPRPIDP